MRKGGVAAVHKSAVVGGAERLKREWRVGEGCIWHAYPWCCRDEVLGVDCERNKGQRTKQRKEGQGRNQAYKKTKDWLTDHSHPRIMVGRHGFGPYNLESHIFPPTTIWTNRDIYQ